jgi:hypothetical protein
LPLAAKRLEILFLYMFKSNFRVKIIEITMTPEGIFAKGIPFVDRKLASEEKKFNIKGELD